MKTAHYNAINHVLKVCGADQEGHKSGATINAMIGVNVATGDIYLSPYPYPGVSVVIRPDGTAGFSTEDSRDMHIGDDAWTPIKGDT